ncbi:MAG: hypothetical protein SGI96_18880 [Bacteroidota bacterium]|nr:hypothetical protein [Bacteroidota bacterium]
MKQIVKRISVAILFLLLFTITSCKKSKSDKGCGCATDNTVQNLVGSDGTLFFMNNQYQQSWFVVVDFPNNGKWLCKICNIDKAQSVINSANASDTISVKISGKLKEFCPNETVGITSGTVVAYHISLDTLKRN